MDFDPNLDFTVSECQIDQQKVWKSVHFPESYFCSVSNDTNI